jgi:peroxiredoxin
MKLNEEIRHVLASYALPREALDRLAGMVADLEENQRAPGLPLGERAPDFALPNQHGQIISLSKLLAEGPAVVTFYRGDWCPFCNLQLAALQRALPDIHGSGASLAAISPQTSADASALGERVNLDFHLLSDREQKTIRDYRLQFIVPPAVREVYLGVFSLDLSEQNADRSWSLPVPGTFILDRQGIVRARHVTADFLLRMEPEDVIAALQRVSAPTAARGVTAARG